MPLIYVTGISGSGKSEVREELRKRGYTAYGTDEDGLAAFYDRASGKIAGRPDNPQERSSKWRLNHAWKIQREDVEKLAAEAKDKPLFLCGTVENDDEVWDLFSRVYALVVDKDTLHHRITTRTNNNFGQNPHELEAIMGWQETAERDYGTLGATIIDATRPIDVIVDEIVLATEPRPRGT